MKILYLLFSFTVGGTERLVIDVCNEMISRGHEVFLYVVNDLIDDNLLLFLNPKITVVTERRLVGSKTILRTNINLYRYIKGNSIDIVHCNSVNTPELLFMSKLLIPNLKVFYTVHSMDGIGKLNRFRVAYRNIICKKIIAISKSVKSVLIKQGISMSKTVTIYNGRQFREMGLSDKEYSCTNPTIGCLGRIDISDKGQDTLVYAIGILKYKYGYDGILCILGGSITYDDDFFELKKYIFDNHLENNILFVGNVMDISGFYQRIDVAVIPSKHEGFGLSFIEALHFGKPSIANDIDAISEVMSFLSDNDNDVKNRILFRMNDPEDLALKIDLHLRNMDGFKNELKTIKKKIDFYFSIARMCDELIDLYCEDRISNE